MSASPSASTVSLWDRSATSAPTLEPLDGDCETQVAIVGGGFTGCSTALHLAEKGIDCRVLEGEKVGHGGSGRNAGLVNPGVWLPPQDVRATLGEDFGMRIINALGEAPDLVFDLIERHQIQCEAVRKGSIHAAHAPTGMTDLTRRAGEWERLGAPVELLDVARTRELTGCDVFHGGLLDRRAGTINPMGYVRGLARAAMNAGARIHPGTRVTALTPDDGSWRVSTERGVVRARNVVLGTNAYTDTLWPGLDRTFSVIHYFQVPTEPLGDRAADILPGGQGVWDTGTVMFSARKDQAGRIILGSMGKVIGGDQGLSQVWARRTLKRLFPRLGDVGWETPWHGRIAMTNDHLPRINRLAPGLYTPIGFNGRGIGPGTVFGRAMAELMTGMPEEELPLPVTEPRTESFASLKTAAAEAAFKAYRVYRSLRP